MTSDGGQGKRNITVGLNAVDQRDSEKTYIGPGRRKYIMHNVYTANKAYLYL